ncbi:hypothetical protein TraAM80_02270 [Trypanosoma rangeli]|uniref:SMP-LTD domain-containing protein n=1 Tax=Trypanosoma rangeli TaxID=5698 RepID=A0A3R7KTD8_TRYRA|nr:uncharacterized protein TraAM80_02270 [Trypanosoma rangeli]RNF09321.1 hypothetical protein TraAM80_02270 [Trypanosoma rangeli]|eukprot:RNF09321.1 hypothetical protein TraAM80_02270 [Trypanosoma rangeli]
MLESLVGCREMRLRQRAAKVSDKEVSLWKVEDICQMARYDNDIVGPVIPVRAVLFGKTISVYQIDRSHKSEDGDHTIIEAEHLIGKINTATVTSMSEKLSKYHRHTDATTRQAPLRGKCLILRRKEGLPLIQEDPVLQLSRQQRRQQRKQQVEENKVEASKHRHHHVHSHHVDDKGASGGFEVGRGRAQRGDIYSDENGVMQAGGLDLDEVDDEKECFDTWEAVLFKFPTRRELERWYNLLQATPQSEEWRVFINHLPSVDVFNLVVARLFFENTRTSGLQDLLIAKIRRKLRRVSRKLPKHIHGEILLDQLELGGEIPLIRGVGEPSVFPTGEVELDFDFLYRGGLKFSLRFAITYRGVRVPSIIFNIKILELSSHMRLRVGPPPSSKIWVGGPRPPQLRLEFTQEVASHDGILNAVLKLMPDMSVVMSNVVKVMLFEDMVLPSMEDLPLPCFGYSPPSSEEGSPLLDKDGVNFFVQESDAVQGPNSTFSATAFAHTEVDTLNTSSGEAMIPVLYDDDRPLPSLSPSRVPFQALPQELGADLTQSFASSTTPFSMRESESSSGGSRRGTDNLPLKGLVNRMKKRVSKLLHQGGERER